jgi:crossover junction endodeoxyribonuclease RuvC
MSIIIGIDPGIHGGIAIIFSDGKAEAHKMPDTERDIYDLLNDIADRNSYLIDVFLESVHSMPGQGVSSSFKFGRGYGFLRGCVTALRYPLHDVTPQKWQRALGCLTGGDKNVSKQKAQQLYPQLKITHATADALLIATYGKQTFRP